MALDFETLRGLQKGCLDDPIRSTDYEVSAQLKEAKRLLDLNHSKEAIDKLTNFIKSNTEAKEAQDNNNNNDAAEANREENKDNEGPLEGATAWTAVKEALKETAPTGAAKEAKHEPSSSSSSSTLTLALAYLLRAECHLKARYPIKARNDAMESIKLRPNLMPAYGVLSEAEKEKDQLGQAELALVLGLFFDAKNKKLTAQLQAFRDRYDPKDMFPQLKNDLSAKTKRYKDIQGDAGTDILYDQPPIVAAVFEGNLMVAEFLWEPSNIHITHGPIKNPLIHMTVLGFQRIRGGPDVEEYKKVIDFLLSKGVRLDARDQMGYTALFHTVGHIYTPELMLHLLRRGADPNVQSILGTTALYDAAMAQNETAVDTLLTHGADPYIKCNMGDTIYKTATLFKKIYAVMDRHLQPKIPAKACAKCGGKASKRCVTCRVAFDCGAECQKADWKEHKRQCKKLVKGHLRLQVAPLENDGPAYNCVFSNMAESFMMGASNAEMPAAFQRPQPEVQKYMYESDKLFHLYSQEYDKKGNLLLKIQVGLGPMRRSIAPDQKMMAYNEDRTFLCYLEPHALDGENFIGMMVKRGEMKGYFWAFMEKGKNEIVVITDPKLPAQPW